MPMLCALPLLPSSATELESGTVTLKDMEAGNQETVALDDLAGTFVRVG